MTAAVLVAPLAAEQILLMGSDIETGCLRLRIMLDSIIGQLDEFDADSPKDHRHIDAIECYTQCAKRMVEDVLASSLSMTQAARQVKS